MSYMFQETNTGANKMNEDTENRAAAAEAAGYMKKSNTDEWGTPVSLFIGACVEFNVTPYLDVCATFQNTKCPRFFNKEFDALKQDWNEDFFMNPPFSKAKVFVKKLLDDMDKFKEIKNALIILPWYFVEDYKDRGSSAAKWYKSLRNRMSEYNFKRFHLKNQPFKRPDGKEVLVRVYAIYLSR